MPDAPDRQPVIVHLIDGTYELFRHFYGSMRGRKPKDPQFAAVRGVLGTVLGMIEGDATHIGVATDHVIESFRNDLWPGYKTGDGVDPALKAQFEPLEQALAAMGVAVWPMVELEADDAMASAVHLAAGDASVHKVCIWTPDKDRPSAYPGSGSSRSTVEAASSAMPQASSRSSASRPSTSLTTWRWSAIRPT